MESTVSHLLSGSSGRIVPNHPTAVGLFQAAARRPCIAAVVGTGQKDNPKVEERIYPLLSWVPSSLRGAAYEDDKTRLPCQSDGVARHGNMLAMGEYRLNCDMLLLCVLMLDFLNIVLLGEASPNGVIGAGPHVHKRYRIESCC